MASAIQSRFEQSIRSLVLSDSDSSGGGEKTFDPTPKKLSDARAKGNIVKSADISVTSGYFGLLAALLVWGPQMVETALAVLAGILGETDRLAATMALNGGASVLGRPLGQLAVALSPLFTVPFLFVMVSLFAQRAFIFAPDKLAPKLSRVSPIAVAKNKFGPTGLFEFTKSLIKLCVISIAVGIFITSNIQAILGSSRSGVRIASQIMVETLINMMWLVSAIVAVISVFDYFWQSYDHNRKLMMSRQEILDEQKHTEGDPHFKQQRRQRGHDIATQRMMADIPQANVVIVNPEHYAVVLKWSQESDAAPVCVAKGVDEVAARIREAAMNAAIPIRRDPPTARAIHATIALGQEIQPEHYEAVAAAIRYSDRIRKLARKRGSNG